MIYDSQNLAILLNGTGFFEQNNSFIILLSSTDDFAESNHAFISFSH